MEIFERILPGALVTIEILLASAMVAFVVALIAGLGRVSKIGVVRKVTAVM